MIFDPVNLPFISGFGSRPNANCTPLLCKVLKLNNLCFILSHCGQGPDVGHNNIRDRVGRGRYRNRSTS